MKNYEEMSSRVFERMAEYETKKKKRNKMIGRVSVAACSLAVVIAAAAAILPNGSGILTAGGTNGGTEYTESGKPIYNGAFVPGDVGYDGAKEELDGSWWVGDEPVSDLPELKGQDSSMAESSFSEQEPIHGHAPNQPYGGEISDIEYLTMIEDYPMPGGATACYKTPANGEWYMTIPLKGAIGEYGNDEDVIYRVAVRVFDEGKWLRDSKTLKEEFARLSDLGYTAVFETFTDNGISTYQLSLHATDEQLLNFVPNPDYGYVLILYKEALHEEQGW